jgi:hypothetical protein
LYLTTPTNVQLGFIPDGVAGITETLREMSRLAKDGKKSFPVRSRALGIISGCNQKDYSCEVRKLHAFVRDNIRYTLDIHNVETIQSAAKTLEFGAGDCDDKSILLASMLGAIGHPTRYVAIGFEPNVYSHVYVETKIGANWIPLETTEPVEAGWEPDAENVRARREWYNH